jgi:hypothetical protein
MFRQLHICECGNHANWLVNKLLNDEAINLTRLSFCSNPDDNEIYHNRYVQGICIKFELEGTTPLVKNYGNRRDFWKLSSFMYYLGPKLVGLTNI